MSEIVTNNPAAYDKLIHDLRNGLAPILMQVQLLSKYAETPEADAEAIKNSAVSIERAVKEMVALLVSSNKAY